MKDHALDSVASAPLLTPRGSAAVASAAISSAAAASSAASAAAAASAAPRRRWLRYPVRVPILSLLLVSLLARSSEGYLSIAGFASGFLLFEGFSAPDTGQPNRIDTLARKAVEAYKRCRGRRRRRQSRQAAAKAANAEAAASRLQGVLACLRAPFRRCCRLRPLSRTASHSSSRALLATVSEATATSDSDGGARVNPAEAALLLPQPAADAADTDVLLDLAVSVTEDPSPQPVALTVAVPGTPASSSHTAAAALQPLTHLTESLAGHLADSIVESLPSLPTVTSLTPDEVSAASAAAGGSSVVGGRAQWQHMSISLRFTIRDFHIHLHHWVYLLIVLLFLTLEQNYWSEHAASGAVYAFASAFCLGGSVQGLKYADWHSVIWRQRNVERRNSRGHVTRRSADAAVAAVAALSPTSRMEAGRSGFALESDSLLRGLDHLEGAHDELEDEDEHKTADSMPAPMTLARATSTADLEANAKDAFASLR